MLTRVRSRRPTPEPKLTQQPNVPMVDATGERDEPVDVHHAKLLGLLENPKVAASDRDKVENVAIPRYQAWKNEIRSLTTAGPQKLGDLVKLLNGYKTFVEIELIWDSPEDFLYRQKGQLKVDNTILEEFLPYLFDSEIIEGLGDLDASQYEVGPRQAFAGSYFATTLMNPAKGSGLNVRTKDQDFAVGRPAYLQASHSPEFPADDTLEIKVFQAFVAAECKTNLDKTMFQEANATAHDLKVALSGSRYYLMCEWLDMAPLSTAGTDIDEVIILRGKRPASNVRAAWSSAKSRQAHREEYLEFLEANPIREDRMARLVDHIQRLVAQADEPESEVLERGYF